MYSVLIIVHSNLRWVVIGLLLTTAALALNGWRNDRAATPLQDRLGLGAMIAFDLQVIIGALLYFTSPVMQTVLVDFRGALKYRQLRFFAVEHLTYVLLALLFLHGGRILARRATDGRRKNKRLAIATIVTLGLIAAAVPWNFIADLKRPFFRY